MQSVEPISKVRVTTSVSESQFAVTGATVPQIRQALRLLGPRRARQRYGAYTDWAIDWQLTHTRSGELVELQGGEVRVVSEVILPTWHAPRSASEAVCSRWRSFLHAVRRHERRHVALAETAGRWLAERLGELPAAREESSIEQAARVIAASALADVRARERAYDELTDHGETEGVHLDESALEPRG